MFQHN